MASNRPGRGVPEGYDIIRVRAAAKPPLRQRVLWSLRTFTKVLLVVFVFGYICASLYMAATIGEAVRDVPQVQAQIGAHYEDVTFQARTDPTFLKGWLFHADHPNGRSVIFVSGWKATRVNAISVPVAADLVAHGYDVLLYDGRGSGQSEGSRQTLGNLEQHDVLGAYDFMTSKAYKSAGMVLYGVSAGGAAVLLVAGQLPGVGAVISDSTFANLHPLLDQGWHNDTLLPGASDWLAIQFGKFLDINPDLSPATAVAATPNRAYLFFHAGGDDLIPVSNAMDLKNASANPHSELVVVSGTGAHIETYAKDPATYMATVYAFIDQQVAAHGG